MSILSLELLIRTLVLILGPMSALGKSTEVKYNFLSMLFSSDHNNSCYKDLTEVALGLFRLEEWALKMLDAAGKPEAGILEGNVGWVGSYEECIGIRKGALQGQHCWINIVIESATIKIPLSATPKIGICVPDSCKNKDFRRITNSINEMLPNKLIASAINASISLLIDCEYDHFGLDLTSFSAIVICCVLLIFIVAGTSIDVLRGKTHAVPFSSFLGYFSLYSNGKTFFVLADDKRTTFGELNGLKAIAMAYVIFAHTVNQHTAKNPKEILDEMRNFSAQILITSFPMPLFFLVTGFLTLNGVVRKPPPKGHKRHFIFFFVLNRYFKMLVVPALIVFVFRVALQPLSSSGPLWRRTEVTCGRHWWRNALFINNWWSMDDQCFAAWWFLSASVQLHLMSLCIIIPLINQRYRLSLLNGRAMLVLSWWWLARKDILMPLFPEGHDLSQSLTCKIEAGIFMDRIHQTPFYNLAPYLIGMALAWFLFKHKEGITLTKKQLFLGWILSSAFLFLALYGIYLRPNRMLRSVHKIFANTMQCLFVAWIILVCNNTKHKGESTSTERSQRIISSVLRWKYWLPLSKLGLGAYLLQFTVIEYFYLSEVDKPTFSWASQWVFFVRNWVGTYLMATIAALTIDMPINAIVDSLFMYIATWNRIKK